MDAITIFSCMDVTSIMIFFSVFSLVYLAINIMRKPAGITPGPKYTLPIIGDIRALIGGKSEGFKGFRTMRQKHGDIFSLYLGRDLAVVINGYDNIYYAAVRQGGLFSARPKVFLTGLTEKPRGLIMANGLLWKEQRKFANASLQEFGFGKHSFEWKVMEEVKCFIEVLSQQEGAPYDIQKTIHASVSNVLFSILCGKCYAYDDKFYQNMLYILDRNVKIGTLASIAINNIPILRYFPGDPLKIEEWNSNDITVRNFLTQLYEEHKTTHDEASCRDFIDYFINEMEAQDEAGIQDSNFSVGQLVSVLGDLFFAGSETTATTIRWAILYLLNFPDIQTRLQNCIDTVIPTDTVPTIDDKAKLTYVEAFIMEVQRCANVVPIAARAVCEQQDAIFKGFRIPKNTTIMFNLESVFNDPEVFEDPTKFNPNRFLDSDEKLIKPKEFIPFGIGRRICLGEAVAKMELFLFITTLIHRFDFQPVLGQPVPPLKGLIGMTHGPQGFEVRAIKRSPHVQS